VFNPNEVLRLVVSLLGHCGVAMLPPPVSWLVYITVALRLVTALIQMSWILSRLARHLRRLRRRRVRRRIVNARRHRIPAVMSFSEYDVDQWAEAIANLHASTGHDPGDERRAYAVANLWSGYGYQDAPTEVIRMLVNAIEIGYMAALNDVRDGDLDDEIRMWRPDLAEQ